MLYICLPALFFSVTVECADLFMCIKFSYHVLHYTFFEILTQLQLLKYCVYTKAMTQENDYIFKTPICNLSWAFV